MISHEVCFGKEGFFLADLKFDGFGKLMTNISLPERFFIIIKKQS